MVLGTVRYPRVTYLSTEYCTVRYHPTLRAPEPDRSPSSSPTRLLPPPPLPSPCIGFEPFVPRALLEPLVLARPVSSLVRLEVATPVHLILAEVGGLSS
jgi:hypothetical protein